MELLNLRFMKRLIVFVISILALSSCWSGFILFNTKKEAKQITAVKYSGKDINIGQFINTRGFYTKKDDRPLIPENNSYSRHCIMFLRDGTLLDFYLSHGEDYKTESDITNNLYKYINKESTFVSKHGIYKVVNDTIYANTFFLNQWFWCVNKHRYKIEGYERLMAFDIIRGIQRNLGEYVFYPINEQTEELDMQRINRSLKKQKWLWDNEEDWKNWKTEQKKRKE